jgi:hypothetical protein
MADLASARLDEPFRRLGAHAFSTACLVHGEPEPIREHSFIFISVLAHFRSPRAHSLFIKGSRSALKVERRPFQPIHSGNAGGFCQPVFRGSSSEAHLTRRKFPSAPAHPPLSHRCEEWSRSPRRAPPPRAKPPASGRSARWSAGRGTPSGGPAVAPLFHVLELVVQWSSVSSPTPTPFNACSISMTAPTVRSPLLGF